MLLAVLEKRVGLKMYTKDVFLNFAWGFKISDTGLDMMRRGRNPLSSY
ncbi:MAG: hypothetical protein ACLR8Y_03810 [Alistipes indistinctus]